MNGIVILIETDHIKLNNYCIKHGTLAGEVVQVRNLYIMEVWAMRQI